jgi:hypothetical protein
MGYKKYFSKIKWLFEKTNFLADFFYEYLIDDAKPKHL